MLLFVIEFDVDDDGGKLPFKTRILDADANSTGALLRLLCLSSAAVCTVAKRCMHGGLA